MVIAPEELLSGYANGIFPMAPAKGSRRIEWYRPQLRGIIPLDGFHISKNMQRWMRNHAYTCTVNQDFGAVVAGCANRRSTWISDIIAGSYLQLHQLGYAHSVEVWRDGQLAGGLYGVSLGAAFFGESMFQTEKDMAKVALYHCHQRLLERGYVLWDTQFYTPHLGTLGCVEIAREQYDFLLRNALQYEAWFDTEPAVRFSLQTR